MAAAIPTSETPRLANSMTRSRSTRLYRPAIAQASTQTRTTPGVGHRRETGLVASYQSGGASIGPQTSFPHIVGNAHFPSRMAPSGLRNRTVGILGSSPHVQPQRFTAGTSRRRTSRNALGSAGPDCRRHSRRRPSGPSGDARTSRTTCAAEDRDDGRDGNESSPSPPLPQGPADDRALPVVVVVERRAAPGGGAAHLTPSFFFGFFCACEV